MRVLVHILAAGPGRPAEAQLANALWDSVCMQLGEPLPRCLELLRARLAAARHGAARRGEGEQRAGGKEGSGGGETRMQHAVSRRRGRGGGVHSGKSWRSAQW